MNTGVATTGRVLQVNVSDGGVPKLPVDHAYVGSSGVEGDRQRDLRHHGGPDRAVCLWSADVIDSLRAEGHRVFPGAAGENITIEAIAWDLVRPGVRLSIGGEVIVEVTRFTRPCSNIADFFVDGDVQVVSEHRNPGASRVYARVECEGLVRKGDDVSLLTGAFAADVRIE